MRNKNNALSRQLKTRFSRERTGRRHEYGFLQENGHKGEKGNKNDKGNMS